MATATKTAKTAMPRIRELAVGATIDQLWGFREQKRGLEAQVKEAEEKIKEIEEQLMERLDKEGLEKATGTKASVSITTSITADVQDWDSFFAYIAKNKFWHLVQKRASDPGVRELWEQGKKVTGVVPFTKKRINLRSTN
jgi:hypothetical protein